MKKCPYCAEEIQDEAIICRYCNKELTSNKIPKSETALPVKKMKFSLWYVILIFLIAFIIFCVIGKSCEKKSESDDNVSTKSKTIKESYTNKSNSELQGLIDELKTTGVLKKIENYDYYIDPVLWDRFNIDAKQGVCRVFADYSKSNGMNYNMSFVYDYYSGKKLAKLDSWGFKTY